MYIAISGSDDKTIALVERHMDEAFLFIDTRDILNGRALTYSIRNGKTVISWGGRLINDVKSVWYRRFMLVQGFELPVPKEKQRYAQQAIRHFNMLLFSQFADSFWLSDFFTIDRANDKLRQLQLAAQTGFNVADTLFTASPEEAKAFIKTHKKVIAKPNYSSLFQQDGKTYSFFTSRVNEQTDFSGFRLAPAILQEAIDVKTELRITVVGSVVFAAAVKEETRSDDHPVRDWRIAHLTNRASFVPFELPEEIRDRCLKLVEKLGLRYGAMDIIIDKSDRYWFLENNPNGQWAFIENDTGQPIAQAIAKLLMEGGK